MVVGGIFATIVVTVSVVISVDEIMMATKMMRCPAGRVIIMLAPTITSAVVDLLYVAVGAGSGRYYELKWSVEAKQAHSLLRVAKQGEQLVAAPRGRELCQQRKGLRLWPGNSRHRKVSGEG